MWYAQVVGLLKRAMKDILRAGIPRFRHPLLDVAEDIHEGNQNLQSIREVVNVETVNELAAERAGEVEDAMFVGRVVRAYRKHRKKA